MSQANSMNPRRMNPTTPKRWRGKGGRLMESRSIIAPKPSKFNFMELPNIMTQVRINKRKRKQALNRKGTPFIKKAFNNTVNFAAALFGMGAKQ